MPKRVYAADLFCGAGGLSRGLGEACERLNLPVDLLAVNHWDRAVESHTRNHPWARHRLAEVQALVPREVVPGGHLHILAAAPECVHFSRARGGRPMEPQKRASAWHIIPWLEHLRVDNLLVENVPEFESWGPLNAKGRPVERRKGEIFQAWKASIEAMGYRVEHRALNAADYGAVTSRTRLFVIARRGRRPVHWPTPTHSRDGRVVLGDDGRPVKTRKWRAAREVLDFSLPSHSIFTRRGCRCAPCQRRPLKPLTQRTLDRIAKGIRDGPHGAALEPLAQAVEQCHGPLPLGAILTREALAELEQAWTLGQHGGATPRPASEPLATIPGGGALRLIEALVLGAGGAAWQGEPRSVRDVLPVILAQSRLALAEPFILPPQGIMGGPLANKARPVDEQPVQSLTQRGGGHLVEPGILHLTHGGRNHSPDDPLPTITSANRGELALTDTAVILPSFGERDGQDLRVKQATEPLDSVNGSGAGALAYLAGYFGNGGLGPVTEPIPALTTKDRYALVEALLRGSVVDVRLRMLHIKELSPAMGFPRDAVFSGNQTEQKRQIGNAVEVNMARSLCLAILGDAPAPVEDALPGLDPLAAPAPSASA